MATNTPSNESSDSELSVVSLRTTDETAASPIIFSTVLFQITFATYTQKIICLSLKK